MHLNDGGCPWDEGCAAPRLGRSAQSVRLWSVRGFWVQADDQGASGAGRARLSLTPAPPPKSAFCTSYSDAQRCRASVQILQRLGQQNLWLIHSCTETEQLWERGLEASRTNSPRDQRARSPGGRGLLPGPAAAEAPPSEETAGAWAGVRRGALCAPAPPPRRDHRAFLERAAPLAGLSYDATDETEHLGYLCPRCRLTSVLTELSFMTSDRNRAILLRKAGGMHVRNFNSHLQLL